MCLHLSSDNETQNDDRAHANATKKVCVTIDRGPICAQLVELGFEGEGCTIQDTHLTSETTVIVEFEDERGYEMRFSHVAHGRTCTIISLLQNMISSTIHYRGQILI